jgi:hypothetical protein
MRILKAGLIAGLAGGALDIIAAMTIYPAMYPGATWMRVLQSVAAGVLGREAARAGGMGTALLGLALHMLIAICAGLVLAYAMKHEAALRRLAPLTGAGFGVAMYYFMQKIVLPLSATGGGGAPDAKGLAVGLAIHIFIFGVPMALIARQFLSEKD